MRIGFGFDVHRLVSGRRLILGGVEIPFEKGLQGHSDADVLTHAVIDALLGACGLPDIGQMFPDTDPQYAGISSLDLLTAVMVRIRELNYRVTNVDVTLVCAAPRIAPFAPAMQARLAPILGCDESAVSIKGKTTEGLGFTGRGEGIAAFAAVLLQ